MLPHGGVLFRMNGVYDEPGTVGTIAALLLAATGFRLHDWRCRVLYAAGVLSFSLAFAALATTGISASAALRRRWQVLLLLTPVFCATSLSLGYVRLPAVPQGQSSSLVGGDGERGGHAADAGWTGTATAGVFASTRTLPGNEIVDRHLLDFPSFHSPVRVRERCKRRVGRC